MTEKTIDRENFETIVTGLRNEIIARNWLNSFRLNDKDRVILRWCNLMLPKVLN